MIHDGLFKDIVTTGAMKDIYLVFDSFLFIPPVDI